MNHQIIRLDFQSDGKASVRDLEIIEATLLETIKKFGQTEFARSMVEIDCDQLKAAA